MVGRSQEVDMDLKNNNSASSTVSQLISSLKSAFQNACFSEVEAALISREEKLKQEIESLKKEKDLLEKQFQTERLDRMMARRECLKSKEEISQLNEEKLKGLKLINELRTKICGLERDKLRAENEAAVYKGRFEELEERVSILEKDLAMVTNADTGGDEVGASLQIEVAGKDVAAPVKIEKDDASALLGMISDPSFGCLPDSINEEGSGRALLKDIIDVMTGHDVSSCKVTRHLETAPAGQTVVNNGTGVHKRKWDSFFMNTGWDDNGENDNVCNVDSSCPTSKDKTIEAQKLCPVSSSLTASMSLGTNNAEENIGPFNIPILPQFEEKLGIDDSISSSSSSDSDDELDLSVILPVRFLQPWDANRACNKWESAADMSNAFERDEQLCMKAVCALYRQISSGKNSICGSSTSQNKGFKRSSAKRGTTLAKFLIDGNPEGKLKKSREELMAYDPAGLDDCRILAIEHSTQLFEMYQKQEDALFLV